MLLQERQPDRPSLIPQFHGPIPFAEGWYCNPWPVAAYVLKHSTFTTKFSESGVQRFESGEYGRFRHDQTKRYPYICDPVTGWPG
jgi:hypothetical protein